MSSTALISRFKRILLKMLNKPVADSSSEINSARFFSRGILGSGCTAVEETTPQPPTISLETLRVRLGEISRAGYTAAVHDLIQKYGATHLSKVDPKDYDSLLKEAEALVNAS